MVLASNITNLLLLCGSYQSTVYTARSSYCSAVLGIVILSVRPSIRPSVRHTRALWRKYRTYYWYFDTTSKGHCSFLTLTEVWTVGNVPFHLKFALKLMHPPSEKRRLQPISAYNIWTVRATGSEKCSVIANRKSTTRFPTSYRWSAYVTHNSLKRVAQKANLSFLWIKFKFNRIKSTTKFLCLKTSSIKVVAELFPSNDYRCWRST